MRPSCSRSSGLMLWLLPWILGASADHVTHPEHAVAAPASTGAHLVDIDRLPLHTQGRHIVNRLNERVKWACVNLYGADSQTFVAGGMEVVPIEQLAARIVDLGFNCIRLPFSLESFATNPHVKKEFVEANPKAYGKRFLDVFDMTISALTDAGLMIILDNHVSNAGWCCHMSQREGLWYQPDYPEEAWIGTLANVTARYMHNPLVVGIGLRNEVHDWINVKLSWGDGNPETDWALAATKAANAVLAVNPNVLIPIMALCSGMCLIPAKEHPIELDVPNRVIYEAHNYLEYVFVNIIPEDLITWHHVRMIVYFMMLFAAVQLVLLFGRWKDLGKPMPSAASLAKSLGYWLCGLAVAGFLFVIGAFKAVSNFCYWWARNGVLPWLKYPAVLLSVGLALILAAKYGKKVLRRLQDEKDVTQDGSDYSRITPERDDKSESSLEEELQPKAEKAPEKKKTAIDITRMSSGELALELVESGVGVLSSLAETKKQQWKRTIHSTTGWCLALCMLAGVDQGITYLASYDFARDFLDDKWGFATEEGQPYTAPVWVGEFSYENEGPAWQHLVRYISERDMDFGFWAVNGKKYGTGFMDGHTGEYTHYSYCDNDHGCDPYEHAWDMLNGRCDQNAMEGTNCAPERSQGANGVCSYQVQTGGKTCGEYCASKGRTCVSASRLSGEGTCRTQDSEDSAAGGSDASCDSIAADEQICTCSMQLWRWDDELFGLLEPDYNTVLEAWRIRDLQALAQSPSSWIPRDLACAGDYRGKKC